MIEQDLCAMKVGTDGVLFGAWLTCKEGERVLDIGVGSGLLSLMVAQRTRGNITCTAVDIDSDAVKQSELNFMASPWSSSLEVVKADIGLFNSDEYYDLILSNPPYFTNGTKIKDISRERARYNDSLSLTKLFESASRLLGKGGRLALIYPFLSKNELLKEASSFGFYPSRICEVMSRDTKPVERILVEFTRKREEPETETLVIQSGPGRHDFTNAYTLLVKEFYTIL